MECKPLKIIPLSENDKDMLVDYINRVLSNDDESLLGHYTDVIRKHEHNQFNGEDREYERAIIGLLGDEILRRMNM